MRRLLLVPLLLLLCASLIPAAQAQDTPAPMGDFMGMVVRDPHYEWKTNPAYAGTNKAFYDTMGLQLQQAGVKWVRIEIFAEELEPQGGTTDRRGRVDVEKYRYFINEVAPRYGFKVLALLATPLVRQRPVGDPAYFPDDPDDPKDPDDSVEIYPPGAYITPERFEDQLTINIGTQQKPNYVNPYMRIWLENAREVAQAFPYNARTGAGIAAFEVMNEQNRYLGGGGKGLRPDYVAALLTKFYRSYREDCTSRVIGGDCAATRIVLGGMHPDRCDDCRRSDGTLGMNDRQYLDAVYKSGAFTSYRTLNGVYPLDGVGYHPYPMEMRSGLVPEASAYNDLFRVPQRIKAMRDIMVANGDAAHKLWITEIGDRGAPATVDPAGDNETRQANFMRAMYFNLSQRRDAVENVFWFKYEDFAVPTSGVGTENWGVVRLMPRPTDQSCPQPIPADRQTCEYEQNGFIERVKLSYTTYQSIAQNGFTVHTTYLPLGTR